MASLFLSRSHSMFLESSPIPFLKSHLLCLRKTKNQSFEPSKYNQFTVNIYPKRTGKIFVGRFTEIKSGWWCMVEFGIIKRGWKVDSISCACTHLFQAFNHLKAIIHLVIHISYYLNKILRKCFNHVKMWIIKT